MAACVRNHDAALLYLELGEFVWPVTLFPARASTTRLATRC